MAIFDLKDADIVQRLQRMRQHYRDGMCQQYQSVEQLMAIDETAAVLNAAIQEIQMLRKSLEAVSRNPDIVMLDYLSLNTKQLLEELACSGVEVDDARLDYVVIQVDRCVWEALQAVVRPVVLRVVPAVKYGIYGQMLPCCRGLDAASRFIELAGKGLVVLKQREEITEHDLCQRGPDGLPLHRVTPLVPYLTLEQWKAAVAKPDENK